MRVSSRVANLLVLSYLAFATGSATAADIDVVVDFASPTGRTASALHHGLNLFQIYEPATTEDNPSYRENLARMQPGLVRLHSWEMMRPSSERNGWIVDGALAGYRWDADKIKKALRGGFPWKPVIMINIPAWPGYLGAKDQRLPRDKYDAFARFCAELVRIVNVDLGAGVAYWEVPNERDDVYQGHGPALAELYVTAAKAMRAVDPSIKIGGPALINPWSEIVGPFLDGAITELDFVSFHTYSTGDANLPLTELFDKAAGLGGAANQIHSRLAKLTSRPIEIFHDEYNISWSPPDPRMNDINGAVFDALTLGALASSRATGAAAWNEADGWYGKLDSNFQRRPASYVFELYNRFLIGAVVQARASAPQVVAPFAVAGTDAAALSLVNRSDAAASVALTFAGPPADLQWQKHQVTAEGLHSQPWAPSSQTLSLPARSITVLSGAKGASSPHGGQAGASGGGAAGSDVSPDEDAGVGGRGATQDDPLGGRGRDSNGGGGAGEDEETAPPRTAKGRGRGCTFGGGGPATGAGLCVLLVLIVLGWRRSR